MFVSLTYYISKWNSYFKYNSRGNNTIILKETIGWWSSWIKNTWMIKLEKVEKVGTQKRLKNMDKIRGGDWRYWGLVVWSYGAGGGIGN